MADKERLTQIIGKLQTKGSLEENDLKELQSHVDALENRGVAKESHHETTSHHHTSAILDVAGLQETIRKQR